MTVLSTLAMLRAAFHRLTNTSATDEGLIEQDVSENEAVDYFLQNGLWAAQETVLDGGDKYRWLATSSALSFTDVQDTQGGSYVALPSNFLRLAGEDDRSALRSPDGTRWGSLIDPELRYEAWGAKYWLMNEQLWVAKGANPPSDLVMDYHWRLPVLASFTFSDFPEAYRPLIVAEAAAIAMEESWFTGDEAQRAALDRHVTFWRRRASRGMRRTQEPKRMKAKPVTGSHWFA